MTDRRAALVQTLPERDRIRVTRIGGMIKIEQLDELGRVTEDVRLDIQEVPSLIYILQDLLV